MFSQKKKLVHDNIDDFIEAVKTREADGMLLDHYMASYFQFMGKLKSLITVKKIEFRREYGLLFSKDNQKLAECLNFFRTDIWRLVQTLTATFKVTSSVLCIIKLKCSLARDYHR